ncbi:phosphatidylserine decarboxylase [Phyllosticta citriasiana]|uniref:Phosphatidylserine decarboxylase n=2 Tax=Phyllosticta citriasiana TaxID=595635 RepID=A0ABR1KGM2_9PEZI
MVGYMELQLRSETKTATTDFSPEYENFSASGEILSITGAFTGVAFLIVLLRVYVRAFMLRYVGPDDYMMTVAMSLSIFTFACFIVEVQYGLGKHTAVMMAEADAYKSFTLWLYIHSLVVMCAVSSVKISIGLFLLRVVERTRYQRFMWGMIVFLICFTLTCACTLIFQCSPIAAAWDFALRARTHAKCFSMNTFRNIGMFNSVVNILTDILFATLPIPLIMKLKVNLRTRLTLSFILSLGFFASAAAIVKAVSQWKVLEESDWTVHDSFNVWNDIELNTGIIAASLPSLKPLFNWALQTARAITSSGGRTNNGPHRPRASPYGTYHGHGYVKQMESSSVALSSMPNATYDGTRGDPYVAEITCGGGPDLERGVGESEGRSGSQQSESLSAGKEWETEARKNSGDEILDREPKPMNFAGGGILRTTEVSVS